jgi:hypothetical protein
MARPNYVYESASTAALLKWRETHARLVAIGATDRRVLEIIVAELAKRGVTE